MSRLVPIGFLTFREAAAKIEVAMFAGTRDRVAGVKPHERHGGDVGDGMTRLGDPPHVADKILNHQCGTISGVAAAYQR